MHSIRISVVMTTEREENYSG